MGKKCADFVSLSITTQKCHNLAKFEEIQKRNPQLYDPISMQAPVMVLIVPMAFGVQLYLLTNQTLLDESCFVFLHSISPKIVANLDTFFSYQGVLYKGCSVLLSLSLP